MKSKAQQISDKLESEGYKHESCFGDEKYSTLIPIDDICPTEFTLEENVFEDLGLKCVETIPTPEMRWNNGKLEIIYHLVDDCWSVMKKVDNHDADDFMRERFKELGIPQLSGTSEEWKAVLKIPLYTDVFYELYVTENISLTNIYLK